MYRQLITRIILIILTISTTASLQAEQCSTRSNSAQFYISDTHIGMGGKCNDKTCIDGWHNKEDFRWYEEFEQFADFLSSEIDANIDLIIVGDFLELWQDIDDKFYCGSTNAKDIGKGRSNFGCNEKQAINRLQEVEKKHKRLFNILAKFVKQTEKDNHIVIIPGNHDAVFAIQKVADKLKAFFPEDVKNKICVDEDGLIKTKSGGMNILVEHGHQIKGDLNRYATPKNGVVECIDLKQKSVDCNNSEAFVRRSWGENLVQHYFNEYEERFPIIDNYSFEGAGVPDGIKRGLKSSSPKEISSALLKFGSFFFFKQTRNHLGKVLENDTKAVTKVCRSKDFEPCIDIESMKSKSIKDPLFVELPPELQGIILPIIEVADLPKQTKLKDVYAYYSDATDNINEIVIAACLYWKTNKKEQKPYCNYKNLNMGAVGSSMSNWFKKIINREHHKVSDHIAQRENKENFKVNYFIYGHTHKAEVFDNSGRKILNTGAWQRVASAERIKKEIDECASKKQGIEKKKAKNNCFSTMSPSSLPACYSYVGNLPGKRPQLLWWAQVNKSSSKFAQFKHEKRPSVCK